MDIKKLILLGIALFLFFTGNSCNYPETVSTIDAELILPPDSSIIYKFTRHYFINVPGDTALFYGARSCTVTVNGIITSITNDSSYLRTITQEGTSININDTGHFVYPQLYQQSSTFSRINENTITRYFEKTDSATLQVAYHSNDIMNYPEKNRQIVMPRTLIIGLYGWFDTDTTDIPMNNRWPTSPIIKTPLSSSSGAIKLDGHSVATKVIALPKSGENKYLVNGVKYENGILVKSYFTVYGETIENSKIVRILGTITITRAYFLGMGLIDQLMNTSIEKVFSDGTVEIIRETVYVARGPEGAKKYSDNEIPW